MKIIKKKKNEQNHELDIYKKNMNYFTNRKIKIMFLRTRIGKSSDK